MGPGNLHDPGWNMWVKNMVKQQILVLEINGQIFKHQVLHVALKLYSLEDSMVFLKKVSVWANKVLGFL